ncbi:MAG: hypothetical protein OHK0046_39080 [Anaerolineae bacterium]
MRHLSLVLLVFIVTTLSLAQSQLTPTPAPSKTPTPEPILNPEVTEEPENDITTQINQPYTQADLNVLVGNVQRPNGMVWHNDMLYTMCNGDWTVYEIAARTGDTRTYIYGVRNGHTLFAEDISETSINLWIPDFDTNSLMVINQQRAPQAIASNLQGPWGIAYLDEEQFLVTNLTGNNVVTISRGGEVREVVSQMRSPAGIVIDDDFVYIANNGSARRSIEWIAKDEINNGENPSPQPLATGLQNTTGLAMGADGYLYFTYALGTRGVVGRLDPEECRENGGCSNDQIEIVLYTELAAPLAGLTLSPDMRLFVHTIFRPEIYWLQLSTE